MAKKKAKLGKNDFGFGKAYLSVPGDYESGPVKIWLCGDEYAEVRIRGTVIDRGQGAWRRYAYHWVADVAYGNHGLIGSPSPYMYGEFGYDKEGLVSGVNADIDCLRSRVEEALDKRRKEDEKANRWNIC